GAPSPVPRTGNGDDGARRQAGPRSCPPSHRAARAPGRPRWIRKVHARPGPARAVRPNVRAPSEIPLAAGAAPEARFRARARSARRVAPARPPTARRPSLAALDRVLLDRLRGGRMVLDLPHSAPGGPRGDGTRVVGPRGGPETVSAQRPPPGDP